MAGFEAVGRRTDEPAGPARAAVVLICDKNYLLPTFASALSSDHHVTLKGVTIEIFVAGADEAWVRQFDRAVTGTRIRVNVAQLPQLASVALHHRDRYLPPIALARFWLDDLLDADIDRFLYIDGDTMVDGDLDSLLAAPPPQGRIMAAPDALAIYIDEFSRGRAGDLAYLAGLQCGSLEYFNSGVIYASRSTWSEIVPEAMEFLVRFPERCRSSDQSALNWAAASRVVLLPQRYNFQTEHMIVYDPRRHGARPTIWHFTSAPKPWEPGNWPWDSSFNRFYVEAEARLQNLGVSIPETPRAQLEAGRAHRRRARQRLTWVLPLRRLTRRQKVRQMF